VTRLAVVVPAHNEQALLPACLHSLTAAARWLPAAVPLELIVVADACADDTAVLAAAAGATVLTTTARNVGRARATGMRHALRHGTDGLWLATTDADSRVPRPWLRWHLEHAEAGTDLLAGSVVVDDWSGRPPELALIYEQRYRTARSHTHGANLGIAAHTYVSAGGFPPLRHDEDVALIAAVQAIGARITSDAGCAVATSARRTARAPHGFAAHLNTLETAPPPQK
jgi:glycosyltransferase involved in cell wall biosynthesis